ncbi:MAG: ferredoxin [Bacteroidetes bacterium]|nr:ferredoxin [Bacteroidota bacterium]
MKQFTVTQQREKCIGCNACVEVYPEKWRMSQKDGKATLVRAINKKGFYSTTFHAHEWKAFNLAAQHCPVKIINISSKHD